MKEDLLKIVNVSIAFIHPLDYKNIYDRRMFLEGDKPLDHRHNEPEGRRRKNDDGG
jgi:hypothetical protein